MTASTETQKAFMDINWRNIKPIDPYPTLKNPFNKKIYLKETPMYKLSDRSLDRLEGVKPILIQIVKRGIMDSPHDFGIPLSGGFRSAADQFILFKKGASKCDGYKNKSYHQSGNALDIYIYENGKANWDKDKLQAVAFHLQEIAWMEFDIVLEWGGLWTSWQDYPHFQIKEKTI